SSGSRCAAGSSLDEDRRSGYECQEGARSLRTGRLDGGPSMRVGIPSEIKQDEYRVAITPAGVRELTSRGHEVIVQAGAGEGSAMGDEQFGAQGARIVPD